MQSRVRVDGVCPLTHTAPSQCWNCARSIRVLDDDAIEDLRKKGVKEPYKQAYDCPDRLLVLYMGEIRDAMNAQADQTCAIANALEKHGVKVAKKPRAKKAAKTAERALSPIRED